MNKNNKEYKVSIGAVSQESRNTCGIEFTDSTSFPGGKWFISQ